ncbi:4-hydroxy-tetrahydrodipicolinate synthase [Roseovarius sp. THAF9]|uniref:dihydrodipicolinate synthase family protein n=1 Tax=Roseovarius sp. THAF9 TaxID=2587847 RepID=UPI001268F6B4|nr:dihydrodipicolinate synthase family protein [Roseovarius sp. THAF9]QFT95039.1 4-hydroxy-tetrahydrodipicolinate synthase [Roseovarius sp. THAF9]
MTIFHGLSAFPITPADTEGRVDIDAFDRLLDRLLVAQVHSVGLLGSTGIYAYLTRNERRRAIEAAVRRLDGKIPLVSGVGALRTDEAVALARDARETGADGLLLAPVSYTPLTEDEVFEHCRSVAEAGALPLCLYNNPSTTHFTFSPALIERLSRLDHIAAIKMPLPAGQTVAAELEDLRDRLPRDFAIGYSGDWGCTEALLAGADAWFSVLGGILPNTALRILGAACNGDADTAWSINARLTPLWDLFRSYGSLRVAYAMAHELDLTEAMPPRPVLPLPEKGVQGLRAAMREIRDVEDKELASPLVNGPSHD